MNIKTLQKRHEKLTAEYKLYREDCERIYDIYQTMLLQLKRENDEQETLIKDLRMQVSKLHRRK